MGKNTMHDRLNKEVAEIYDVIKTCQKAILMASLKAVRVIICD